MTELLAPAGNMEALRAAVANGCDAVYLGMQRFGARAYSCNFDEDNAAGGGAVTRICGKSRYYVTMNTIVFENELSAYAGAARVSERNRRGRRDRAGHRSV